jgi:twitching motility protein PilT
VAQLDSLLKALVDRNAEELILSDGKQPVFRFGEEMRTVSPKVLNRAQISLLISELAGQDQAARIAAGQSASFVYRPGDGTPFQCEVAGNNGTFCARLRPASAEVKAPDPVRNPGASAGETAPRPAVTTAAASPRVATSALEIDRYLTRLVELEGSDLHLSAGESPMIRLHGDMQRLDGAAPLTAEETVQMLEVLMPDRNRTEFEETHDTDFAYEIPNLSRFRVNIFMDRKGTGAVFRTIPTKILTAEQLNLPKSALEMCNLSKGLVVVTGPTGSGKSTTLAAMVDHINQTRTDHIITIEDPIEFVHQNRTCLVNQREIITHTDGFKKALRAALREDPDIVLVGEMRDLETIAIAIETAETGHLVFGTLHTTTACSTIDRIID